MQQCDIEYRLFFFNQIKFEFEKQILKTHLAVLVMTQDCLFSERRKIS